MPKLFLTFISRYESLATQVVRLSVKKKKQSGVPVKKLGRTGQHCYLGDIDRRPSPGMYLLTLGNILRKVTFLW